MHKTLTCFIVGIFTTCSVIAAEQTDDKWIQAADQSLIDHMVRVGTNPDKTHYVSYIIDCQSESLINEFIAKAEKLGYEDGYASFSESTELWSTSYSQEMKLNVSELAKHRAPLTKLLPPKGCEPISWGATVER